MYHLIVYTIKPDVNAKLLLRSITYICDPVHLYCIASITEEASATSGATPSASPASRRRSSPCAPRRTSASTTCRWWPPTPIPHLPPRAHGEPCHGGDQQLATRRASSPPWSCSPLRGTRCWSAPWPGSTASPTSTRWSWSGRVPGRPLAASSGLISGSPYT